MLFISCAFDNNVNSVNDRTDTLWINNLVLSRTSLETPKEGFFDSSLSPFLACPMSIVLGNK